MGSWKQNEENYLSCYSQLQLQTTPRGFVPLWPWASKNLQAYSAHAIPTRFFSFLLGLTAAWQRSVLLEAEVNSYVFLKCKQLCTTFLASCCLPMWGYLQGWQVKEKNGHQWFYDITFMYSPSMNPWKPYGKIIASLAIAIDIWHCCWISLEVTSYHCW